MGVLAIRVERSSHCYEQMKPDEILWRVFYDDDTTFDNIQGNPEDVPAYGVICIVFPDELVGRVIMHGWDWYYWVPPEEQWWGSEIHGYLDRKLHRLPSRALCQGRNVSNKRFAEIMGAADKDPDFPLKSGFLKMGESPHGPRSTIARLERESGA